MSVFYDIEQLPSFRNAVVTIGTFDGVHEGHKAILRQVVSHAREADGESVLITFEPHPRKVLQPEHPVSIITPLEQKLELISATGIEHIVVMPFTMAFADLSASDYIEQFLVKLFQPHSIIIGYDHRFGHDRTGDLALLRQYADRHSFQLVEIPAQVIDEAAISSTKIRKAISGGNAEVAAQMLGRPFSFSGTVVHGNKKGRTIGYPTANIEPNNSEQVLPGLGVYAVRVRVNNELHGGMLNIGYNPTVTDAHKVRIEVHIFEFEGDIYNCVVDTFFYRKLRDEVRFDSLDSLKKQLALDKKSAIDELANLYTP